MNIFEEFNENNDFMENPDSDLKDSIEKATNIIKDGQIFSNIEFLEDVF